MARLRSLRLAVFVVTGALAAACGSNSGPGEAADAGADASGSALDAGVDSTVAPGPDAGAGAPDADVADSIANGLDAATIDAGLDAELDAVAPPLDAGLDASDAAPPMPKVNVLTQHNDVARTGANLAETVLTTENVNTDQFGKLFCRAVDDQIYTQPLIVTNVAVPAMGTRDVVYVATMSDSVYAFDATDPAATTPLWSRSYLGPGITPVQNTDMTGACGGQYTDISGNIGIMGTPVIDPATATIYFVTRTKENGGSTFVQRLHALDIADGSERLGSPTTIVATVLNQAGTPITFDPLRQNQRAALLLDGGIVYVTYASHCDWGPYNGWILGYDATTLQQVATYNSTPDGFSAGIWMSGQGPAADGKGSIYVATGNGTVGVANDPADPNDRGESVLRLTRSGGALAVASFFTPHEWQHLNDGDLDLGSGGVLLVPETNLALAGGKSSKLYALDRTTMGGLTTGRADDPSVQVADLGAQHIHGSPVYWKGPAGPQVYTWAEYDRLKALRIDPATSTLDPVPASMSPAPAPDGMPGGMLTISANGATEGSGIVWADIPDFGDANNAVVRGKLRAFDAANVSVELWNTGQNDARDFPGNFAKFTSPTVANGRVYLATFSGSLCVYGLLPNVTPLAAPTGLTATPTSKTSVTLQWLPASTTETGFAIERKEGTSGFGPLATTPPATGTFVDGTAVPFSSYVYRVRALGTPAPSPYAYSAPVVMNVGAPAPRILLTGAGRPIGDGATTTSWTTDTDFGGVTPPATTLHTFTIQNIGNAPLDLAGPVTLGGAGGGAFTITTPPASPIAAGGSATFAVTFAPTAPGPDPATIQITSDDPDQSPFTFAVSGMGVGDQLLWWHLDETTGVTAADASGQGNDGTGTAVTWGAGHTGGAASFDGATSYFSVADNASLDPLQVSVAAWIKPVDWAGNRRIVQKGPNDDQFRLLAEGGVFVFDVAGVGRITTPLPAVNVWTHVAGTYDLNEVRLYVNGVMVASAAATTAMNATTGALFVGTKGAGGTAGDHFNGWIDEVRVYGRGLTAAEVAGIAQ